MNKNLTAEYNNNAHDMNYKSYFHACSRQKLSHTHIHTYSIIFLTPFIMTVAVHSARLKYILPAIWTLNKHTHTYHAQLYATH